MSAIFKAGAVSAILVVAAAAASASHTAGRIDPRACLFAGALPVYHTRVGQPVAIVSGEDCVRPGHGLRDLRFVWGDGTSSVGRVFHTRERPPRYGLREVLVGRHVYA